MRATATACALAAGVALIGCDGDEKTPGSPDPQTERSDPAAKPPPGWQTVANRSAGLSVSVPNEWTVRRREGATLLRSEDRLLVVTLAADRSRSGRETPARSYASEAFRALPGFTRLRVRRVRRVRGSPYESGRVDGTGTLAARKQKQHVAVASFRRKGRVTYTAVVFAANTGRQMPHARQLDRLLASFRAQRPRA